MDEFKRAWCENKKAAYGHGGPKCPCCHPKETKAGARQIARRRLKDDVQKQLREHR